MTAPRDTDVFRHAPWRHLTPRAIQTARAVPTMLQDEEQKLYFWLTALWARDAGAVVDLGCFVGGSTALLAAGAAAAGLRTPIHAYDRFTAEDTVKAKTLYPAGIAPFDGNDTLPLAQGLLAPWADRITLHPGDIEDQSPPDDPVEILVVDAAKTAGTADAIAQAFFPALLPGRSLVVQQDFLHWRLPWLPVQMALLGACFTPVARCGPTSMLFLCTHAPDPDSIHAARVAHLTDAELTAQLSAAEPGLAGFGASAQIAQMTAAIAANPGERTSWRLRRP
ncbi:hypothetical protein [Actibacterium ureilyticum]|uniref:hypothetical protein n=1 Tax=Actibacterium ureilyticum TaxID=1590614 RepID=UPI000BAB22B9|nr:hypothetical protein [Actibacterium ureilyticum]